MNLGQQIMGGGKPSEQPYAPTREQRRAAQKARARQQRRGQRAFNRQTNELDFDTPQPTRQQRRRAEAE